MGVFITKALSVAVYNIQFLGESLSSSCGESQNESGAPIHLSMRQTLTVTPTGWIFFGTKVL